MQILFEASFEKDLKRIRNKNLLKKLTDIIDAVKLAPDITQIPKLKKLKGHTSFYRIRLDDYRIGLDFVDNTIIFVRFLHRKDIYRYFP